MLPEEKLAARFSEKHRLRPPVKVRELVQQAADLEEDDLPGGYDAVFLGRSRKRSRPLVVIAADRPNTRKTFTLAHELGHIVIPWHIGTHFCSIHYDVRLVDELVRGVEAEANRFAAEILMPENWIKKIAASRDSLKEKVHQTMEAGVSCLAASFRLIRFLPADFAFIEVNSGGEVERASASLGTGVRLPPTGSRYEPAAFDRLAQDSATFPGRNCKYIWWHFAQKLKSPKTAVVSMNATDLLKYIAAEVCTDEKVAAKSVMSINGIIGAANNTFRKLRKGDFFTLLKQRFVNTSKLKPFVSHPLFDIFLQKRADEIKARDDLHPF